MDETNFFFIRLYKNMENNSSKSTPISGIYRIKNTTNKRTYVGASSNIRKRINAHKHKLNSGVHQAKDLQADWVNMGEDCFEFEIIEECSPEEFFEKEQFYMDYFSSYCLLYNTQLKASKSAHKRIGKPKDPDAVRRSAEGNKGKKRTKEQIDKKRVIVGKE